MSTCQNCEGKSTDAFLCGRCVTELRKMLADLPWWLSRLTEAAVGDVRMGDSGGNRAYNSRYPINGEHNISHYLATFPTDTDDLPDDDARNRRYGSARRQALAAGGVNDRASTLMDEAGNTLSTIVRGLCESRGVDLPPELAQGARTGVAAYISMAQWLSGQLGAIAASEDAGQNFADIHNLIGDHRRDGTICRAVNRPIPMRFLGKCPTWNEDSRSVCGYELKVRADVVEAFCRKCRKTHNADRLQLLMVMDLDRSKVTAARILELNRMLPEDYRIPERTLRHWRSPGLNGEPPKLKARGYLRPNGREVIVRHSDEDEPLYLWADVRRLRAEQWKVSAS